jgi:hypothetical protein
MKMTIGMKWVEECGTAGRQQLDWRGFNAIDEKLEGFVPVRIVGLESGTDCSKNVVHRRTRSKSGGIEN